ncbi:MAG TPA: cell wall-binding repeat-containing protein [Acidimicrobiales bacterium]|nr:cell wall-binding repeat-containing protein [Acidimicrobiales bacterium]
MSRIGGSVLVAAMCAALLSLAPDGADAATTDVTEVWRRDIPGATVRESSPSLMDLDADGRLDIVFGAHDRRIHALHGTTGANVAGWPVGVTDKVDSSVSSADIDGDGRVELFVGAGTSEAESGALYSFQHDGRQRFRLQAADKVFPAPAVHSTPAIGDTDGSADENVSFGTLGLLGAWSVSSSGNVRGGCPADVEYPTGACWPFYTDDTVYSSPALADADGNGINEVIIGADSSPGAPVDHQGGFMRAIRSNRTVVWEVRIDDIVRSSPSIGNIDGDPGLEVVFGAGDFWGGADSTKVFAVNVENGSPVAGWPQSTNGVTNASPTLADLDGDGDLDVAIGTFSSTHGRGAGGSIYAWNGAGEPISGFPTGSGAGVVLGQLVTADLDADGGQDLIATMGGLVRAVDGSSGAELFRLTEGHNVVFQNSAAVTDIEGDGRLDLIAAGTVNTPSGDGRVYRWRLGPEATLGANGWHESRQNQRKTGSFGSGFGPTTAIASSRISGADRFATAAELSKVRSPNGVTTAYVATGTSFADALAGGPAADQSDGTVLLVTRDAVPSATRAELVRLDPDEIVILGGTGAVSDTVANALEDIAPTRRVSGDNRYATAAAISADTFAPLSGGTVYVATGESFPDALAGASAGALNDAPVLLVTKDDVPSETQAEIQRLAARQIVILGGTNAVSPAVEQELRSGLLAPPSVTRIAGADRYATSVELSKALFPNGADVAHLATGRNFPDALAGGPVAAAGGGPLVLTPGTCLPSSVRTELSRLGVSRSTLLGGSGAISGALGAMQAC